MSYRIGLNYPANCGPFWATEREVRRPCSDNGSNHSDQTAYRAQISATLARLGIPETLPQPPPYVPPAHPNCMPRCRNGWHDPACSERR